MLELNTQTREDKRKQKVKLTQKVKKITYIDNFEREIQELYQTSEDSGIPSKARLDSNSQTTNPTLESEKRMSSNGVCYK